MVLHGLLQHSPYDIILVQEPWFGRINTLRDDSDPDGVEVRGTTANNKWECILPQYTTSETCKVAIYIRVDLARRAFVRRRDDLLNSISGLIVDLSFDDDVLRLITIYHTVPKKGHGLGQLLSLELDPLVPTLIAGDFNTHGPAWSLPGATLSPWAHALEGWFDDNELSLCNPHGIATWLGREDQRPSVLDLLLLNPIASSSDQFSDTSVSFELSLGSDHAALSVLWTLLHALPPLPRSTLPGFAIEDDLQEQWCNAFATIPNPVISSPSSLAIAADCLISDINDTSAALFEPRKTPDPRGTCWWSAACSAALATVQSASWDERQLASRAFSVTLVKERRKWADAYLHHTSTRKLWEATRWHHGRHISRIPPLRLVFSGPVWSGFWT